MAEVFYVSGEMEKTGRGMMLISSTMQEAGRKLPEWTSANGRTTLRIYRTAYERRLNGRVMDFMATRRVGERFSKQDYMGFASDMTEATAKKDLALMVEQKLCRKEGAGPATVYVVLDKK